MRSSVRIRLAALLAAVVLPAVLAPPSMGAAEVGVRLELSQQFFYEDDPLNVRITVFNRVDKKAENPIQVSLFDGFRVKRDDRWLERTGKTTAEEPSRPEKIAAGSFYGSVVNLVDLYPKLGGTGTYEISWSADGIFSDALVVTVLPRFDPTKEYVGEIRTSRGTIVVNLYGKESPIAVKSFIDLANAGFYEGLQISEVRVDNYVVGGDPRFADPPRQSIQYPTEQSTLPLVAGTVVMRPVRATPPANGSTFVILLRPQPTWAGQVTVLGQVVDGLDTVQRLSRVPSSMRNTQPNFKPLDDVEIRSVTIREKSSGDSAS
jgi:peptidyl-prolyl cis-trans isomerase A (cyclophilin A)